MTFQLGISTPDFSTPWFKNWGLGLKGPGLKRPGLKLGVEKSRVEMSFNLCTQQVDKKVFCHAKDKIMSCWVGPHVE